MSEQVSAGITDTDSLVSDGEPEPSNHGSNGKNTTDEVGPKSPWTKVNLLGKGRFATVYEAVDRSLFVFFISFDDLVYQEIELLKQVKHDNMYNIWAQKRDIKCANILVDTKGICKLADFGLAKQFSSLDQIKSFEGSVYWMAPEVIGPKKVLGAEKTYGPPADIWSLGCTIIEMATGAPPFAEMEWHRVLWNVGLAGHVPPIPDCLAEVAKDFVKHCLEVNPANRGTATEFLKHEFVRRGSESEYLPNKDSSKWFEDPITWETMCDPVKCNDGFTYDRWTIIDNDIQWSPYDRNLAEFFILCDDINLRRRLFEKIPKQIPKFRTRRQNYQKEALQKTHALEFEDAVKKLKNILKGAPLDKECQNKLSRLLNLPSPQFSIVDTQ